GPADIHDETQHENIANAHPLSYLPAGHGTDHDLGYAKRQCPHDGSADGCARRAAQTEHAVHHSLGMKIQHDLSSAARGQLNGVAPVIGMANGGQAGAGRLEDFFARDIWNEEWRLDTHVNDERVKA